MGLGLALAEAGRRTVAEALTNVGRHAQATRAAVTIEAADRLSRLGGTLSVESPPGGPTRVVAEVPLLPYA